MNELEKKLTISEVKDLYLNKGYTRKKLAKHFNTSFSKIGNFLFNNKIYKDNTKSDLQSYRDLKSRYSTVSPVMDTYKVSVQDLANMARKK